MNQISFTFVGDALTEDNEEALNRICPRGTHRWLGLLVMAISTAISITGMIYLGKWVVSFFG